MVKDLIEGNQFGGQLLVKINRVETNNPKPISKSAILFDKGDEKGADEEKSKLFAQLAKTKEEQGKKMDN